MVAFLVFIINVLGYVFMLILGYAGSHGLAVTYVGMGQSDEDKRRRKRVRIVIFTILAIYWVARVIFDISYPSVAE